MTWEAFHKRRAIDLQVFSQYLLYENIFTWNSEEYMYKIKYNTHRKLEI